MRRIIRGPQLVMLAIALSISAGCQNSDATPDEPSTVPDTTISGVALPEATTTTTLSAEETAYKVYREFLDATLVIGFDLDRRPDDGSLDPFTTPSFRADIVRNLDGLKKNGLTQKGRFVTRPLGSQIRGETMDLRVCLRDDVDQFDRTGKQLSPPGQGVPQVAEVRLVRQNNSWLLENSKGTAERCDV